MTKKGITSLVFILLFSFCRHSNTPLESLYPRQDLMLEYQITAEGEDWGRRFGYSKIKNRGIGGDVTYSVLARLDEIIYFKPRAVFLLIGINDLWNNTPTIPKPAYIGTNIIKIADIIKRRSSDTKVYIQTVLPIHK